ncbi:MAG: biotin--[acetyl-CoA-carboxylase] ligase [Ignavibacteria bacterium]|nr:biotin--[acetyl-CoA-carboxylase] ligase [Ignavibacteria bacterium]
MLDIEKIRAGLAGNDLVSSVLYLEETPSTNEYCASPEVPPGTLVITDNQTAGKGRMNRKWESEKDSNLTFSIKTKFNLPPAENQSVIRFFSYFVYMILLKEIKRYTNSEGIIHDLVIKWPNDILYKGRKLCGILTEAKLPSGLYITGIGINCNQAAFSTDLCAISLYQITGAKTDLDSLLVDLLNEFSSNLDFLSQEKLQVLFEKWKQCANITGKKCEFINPDMSLNSGEIIDLRYDGSIVINVKGNPETFYSGDLKLTQIY